jgi:hypothetical protein
MKPDNYLPLTKKQLNEIVSCYAPMFAEWECVKGQVFTRTHGPIMQCVGIEPLRYKAYRPWSSIRATPLPTVRMLHQVLDIKHRAVELRAHPLKWKEVMAAMEEQFEPPIRKPLDLREIGGLCEQRARQSTNDLCMLAILNAYTGETEKALISCEQMQSLPAPTLAPRLDWEERHKEFGRQLRQAIEAGKERQFLDAAAAAAPEVA